MGGYGNVTFSCSLLNIYGIGVLHSLSLWLYFHFFYMLSVQTTPVFYIVFWWFYHAGKM